MPRGYCQRHGPDRPCTCAMGNVYRFVEPVVLYLLGKNGPSYGYELLVALNEQSLTDAKIERAALYRTLKQLEEQGSVASEWDVSGSGPARHIYRLTDSGAEHLHAWTAVLDKLAQAMTHFVHDAHGMDDHTAGNRYLHSISSCGSDADQQK